MALASEGRLLADRYRVLGRLGAGGMAVVVLAEDERLGRKVAVKRLHADSPEDAARRFQREAKLGASLNHPNIVAIYDTVADEEGVLIVMEYVDGHTLRLEMDRGPMEPARAIEVLSGMAAGLDHAHEQGVVHRDVKPANVLIAVRDGAVKLADLGIATAAERTNITRSGVVLGTAAYMAPERLDGQAGGPPVDVYAMAALAFEMLSGRRAITGKTAIEVARRVMEAEPPSLADVLPGTPARAAAVVARGMAKDPAERPVSSGELVRELAAAYAEEVEPAEPEAEPPTTAERAVPVPAGEDRRRWVAPALLAALAAAVVAIVLLAGSGSDDENSAKPATRSAPAREPAAPVPPATDRTAPATALTSFYTRAADDDFQGAWDLGTANLHAQFGSLGRFTATLDTLERIEFPTLRVTADNGDQATVAFSTVARHTDRVDRCRGQASLVRSGDAWLVDHLDVACG